MKSPTLYLMLGYPGAGKTTVSEYIHKYTGAVHLNSDQFRLRMFKEPLDISDTEHENMYKLLDHITERTLRSGKSVVYDANLNRYAHRKEKYAIAKRVKADVKLVWVRTALDEARERATVRAEQHPDHRPFGNMQPKVFDRLTKQIEPPKKEEKAVEIDGNEINGPAIRQALGI